MNTEETNQAKKCLKCGEVKDIIMFVKNKNCCKKCKNNQNKERSEKYKANYTDKIKPENKFCPGCKQTKTAKQFYTSKSRSDGLKGFCITCCKQKHKQYGKREIHPSLIKEKKCNKCNMMKLIINFQANKYHKDGCQTCCKECVSINNMKLREKYSQQVKVPINKVCPKCNELKEAKEFDCNKGNKTGLASTCKLCNKSNEKLRIFYKLKIRIKGFLNSKKKENHTMDYVQCSKEFLIEWLKYTFKKEYPNGTNEPLHIDHILPLYYFSNNEEDLYKSFHWSNLHYMPASENLKKSKKRDLEKERFLKELSQEFLKLKNSKC
jgi:hypothetical protein